MPRLSRGRRGVHVTAADGRRRWCGPGGCCPLPPTRRRLLPPRAVSPWAVVVDLGAILLVVAGGDVPKPYTRRPARATTPHHTCTAVVHRGEVRDGPSRRARVPGCTRHHTRTPRLGVVTRSMPGEGGRAKRVDPVGCSRPPPQSVDDRGRLGQSLVWGGVAETVWRTRVHVAFTGDGWRCTTGRRAARGRDGGGRPQRCERRPRRCRRRPFCWCSRPQQ